MISETAAAFHTSVDPGIGELQLKKAWWSQFITNVAFFRKYPRLKSVCLFEVDKFEEFTQRDFRISFNAQIRDTFLFDLKSSNVPFVFANCIDKIYRCNSTLKLLSKKESDRSVKIYENGSHILSSYGVYHVCIMILFHLLFTI